MNAQPLQRTDKWQAQRIGRITGSRVGAILGLSKYRTRADVMREMVRQTLGAAPEFTGNEATRYGEAHEADAINAYEQRYGALVMPSPLVVHPDYNWLAASPDGLIGDDGMIEVKCPFRAQYTEPSQEYKAQMMLQMACTGRYWCDFVIWREGSPILVTRIPYDAGWFADTRDTLQAFHAEYLDILSDDELSAPYLAGKERDDHEWAALCSEYIAATRAADEASRLQQIARDRMIASAPQGAKGCGVTLSVVERQGTIAYAKAIKQMLPDVDLEPFRGKPSTTYMVKIV